MIKQIKQYAKEKNLTIDSKANLAYGDYNGQFINIWEINANQATNNREVKTARFGHLVKIWVKADEGTSFDTIQSYVQQLPGKVDLLESATYDGKVITAFFVLAKNGIGWSKNYASQMDGFLRDVTNFCASYRVSVGCEFCGTGDALALYQLNETPHLVCPNCLNQVDQQAAQSKAQFKAQGQGNVLFGIVGALLGALLGVAVWVGIYELGYISAIGAMALVVCAFKGYELLGGRMTKLGIVISSIVSVIMLLFAEQLCLAIEIYQIYHVEEGISFFEAFRAVPYFLMEPDILKAVLPDILLGGICVVAGSIATGVQTYKERTGAVATRMIARISGK